MTERLDQDSADLDEFERLGRRAGAELRAAAPPGGASAVTATASRRRATAVAGMAMALMVLLVGGFVALRRYDDRRGVTDTPSPTTTVLESAMPYRIVGTRFAGPDLEIVQFSSEGRERLVRTLSPDVFGPGAAIDPGGIAVSSAGWLSAYSAGGRQFLFVDLLDPASTPRVVRESCVSGRWSPAGDRYAAACERGTVVIDPSTGAMVDVPGYNPVDGTPEPVWSADGTALLSAGESNLTGLGGWRMVPIDGGPSRPGSAPLYWQRGTRYIDDRGRWIDRSTGGTAVTVESDASVPEAWYDGDLAPAQLRDSSFTSSGGAIWLLLSTVVENQEGFQLVRATGPGQHEVVVPFVPFEALRGAQFGGISAVAPDDALLVASARTGADWNEIVVRTDGGAAFALPPGTHVAGFVPNALANGLG